MHGLVWYKLEHRCWRACGKDVSFRDVKIKIPDRKFDQEMWMTLCTGSARGGIGGFWKTWESIVENVTPNGKGRLSGLAEARRIFALRAPHVMGGGLDGKVIIERLCISLPYVETFNSKVIKGFVPELKSRYVFSGIPMFYVYMLWTFRVRFNISISGYATYILCVCGVCVFDNIQTGQR